MRFIFVILMFLPVLQADVDISQKLINALIQVESNGNDKIIGDNGKSKGCLQIHNVVILDVNRVYKSTFKHSDAFDRELAQSICEMYLKHWSKYYKRKSGKEIDNEGLARLWNSGPKWFTKKHKTHAYWKKVNKCLKTLI